MPEKVFELPGQAFRTKNHPEGREKAEEWN
jgi:hypothetical protein